MSMKRERLERMAVRLAKQDAAESYPKDQQIVRLADIELEASELFLSQYDWYIERAAKLWGRMQ